VAAARADDVIAAKDLTRADGGALPRTDSRRLTDRVESRARDLGFDLFGVCGAGPVEGFEQFQRWIDDGMAGEMRYLEREPLRRSDPRQVMPTCRSVIVSGMVYRTDKPSPTNSASSDPPRNGSNGPHGAVARYARGTDYHEVMKERLLRLLDAVREEAAAPVAGKVYVDTGPLLERDLAYAAGLGWRAKNTHLIHPRRGSYFFLGELLLDIGLSPTARQPDRCGSCTRCLDACPTAAFVGPGVLDARRCISYLTIELRGPIPMELRPLIGNMVFGCDICQEVCPWNRHAPEGSEPAYRARTGLDPVDLIELMGISQEEFSRRFRGSAIKRAKRRGLLRNAAVALGNSEDRRAIPALRRALQDHEALVRGHAAWAMGRIGGPGVLQILQTQLSREADEWVRDEVEGAIRAVTAKEHRLER